MSLSPREKIQLVRQVYSLLNVLTKEGGLAGIVLTSESYDQFKKELGHASIPFTSSGVALDLAMEHTFVVDGLLIMRGTQLEG
jgi:hypothetical protein